MTTFIKKRAVSTDVNNNIIMDKETEAGLYEGPDGKYYYWTDNDIKNYRESMEILERIENLIK